MIVADKNCTLCKGSGISEYKGKRGVCPCVIRQKAQEYLTPIYKDVKYMRDFDSTVLEGKNILIESTNVSYFKEVAKSFLLNTAMKYSHLTLTAYDVVTAWFENPLQSTTYKKVLNVDIMLFYLVSDPKNAAYGDVLTSVIEKRMLNKKALYLR
jgi:hypothetical protein